MYEKFLEEVGNFIFMEDQPELADIIFVPGNSYPYMAEKAAELYRLGLAPMVLPSGRYSISSGKFSGVTGETEKYNEDYQTEWEFLKDVLMKNGVPESAVLREDEATFTWQNALFSRKVTDQAGLKVKKQFCAARIIMPEEHLCIIRGRIRKQNFWYALALWMKLQKKTGN